MRSIAKAAVISAVVLRCPWGRYSSSFSRTAAEGPGRSHRSTMSSDTKVEPEKVEPKEPVVPLEVIHGDEVKLTVEVVEKGSRRKLPRSRLMVFHAGDGDRPGRTAWESGKAGNGSFEMSLRPGVYVVHAQCPRYRGEKKQLALLKDTPQNLLLELGKGDSISGKVLDVAGRGIAGARVVALEELGTPGADIEDLLMEFIRIPEMTGKSAAETVSMEDGSYQLDGLETKYYTVRAVGAGHAPNQVAEVPSPRQDVNIVLQKGGTIGGVVKNDKGRPVEGATVKAYREIVSESVFEIILEKSRPAIDSATTEADGSFKFETLGAGLYSFLVEAKGHQRLQELKKDVKEGTKLQFSLKTGLKIQGLVRGPNDEPVGGARVRASPFGGNNQGKRDQVNISFDDDFVRTDEQGAFAFDTLEEGTFLLLCWHDDYQTLRRQDVRPSGDEIVLKLSAGGRVRGRVGEHGTGKAIAGARITAQDVADVHKDAISGDDGTYVLSGLQTGTRPVSVSVFADGYSRLRRDVRPQEGREVEENFDLQQTGSVTGIVVNTNGDAVRGARVMVKKSQPNTNVEQTIGNDLTDAEGRFSLPAVESGDDLWLRVKKSEYLEATTERFSVTSGQPIEVAQIVLQLGGSVSGKVVGADGKGIPGCQVTVSREGETEIQRSGNPSSHTNAQGEFVIQGLASGTIDLIAKASHFMEKSVTGVEVLEGQLKRGIVIQLEKGNSVGGIVRDGNGEPVRSANVIVRDLAQGAKELRGSTGDDGAFSIDGILSAESVVLEVSHENYGAYSNENAPVGGTAIEIVLRELGKIRGSVIDPDGKPVESFTVQPTRPEARTQQKKLKPETYNPKDGAFEYAGVPAGTYTVNIRALQFTVASVPNVKVAEGEVVDLGEIVLELGGTVNGRVIDSQTSQGIEGVRVQVVQGTSRFVRADPGTDSGSPTTSSPIQVTGSDGSFTFTGLKSGNLALRFSHEVYVGHRIDDVNPDVPEKSRDLQIVLDKGGEISGMVIDKEGQPRAGMPVYLIGSDAGSNQTMQTDEEGRFHFGSIPTGTFTVKAHKFASVAGQKPEQADEQVEMVPGAAFEVTLQLP